MSYADDSHQLYIYTRQLPLPSYYNIVIYHNKTKSSVVTNVEGIRTTNGTNRWDAQNAYLYYM